MEYPKIRYDEYKPAKFDYLSDIDFIIDMFSLKRNYIEKWISHVNSIV